MESLKVIGIHTSSIKKTKETLNIGTFLNFLLNIEFKTKQNKYSVNEIKVEKKISPPHNNEGSWFYIFNEIINNNDKVKEALKFKKSEEEIKNIAKNVINEIKVLRKIFIIFYGCQENAKFYDSIQKTLQAMLIILTGIKLGSYNDIFNEIEKKIKYRLRKGLNIIDQTEKEENVRTIREYFINTMISLTNDIYSSNEKERNKSLSANLNGFLYIETLGTMFVDNIFSCESQKEQDKVFNNAYNEVLNKLKNKQKIYDFLKININFEDSDKTKKDNDKDHENEDWEVKLKNSLRHDWNIYFIYLGIICPMK